MAKKNKDLGKRFRFWNDMREETIQAILAIIAFLIVLLSLLAAFHKGDGSDLAGPIGGFGFSFFTRLFGIGYFLIPIVSAIAGVALIQGIEKKMKTSKIVAVFVLFLSSLGLIHIARYDAGGIFGRWVAAPFLRIFGLWASLVILIALVIIALFMLFEAHLSWDDMAFWRHKAQKRRVEMDEDEEAAIDEAVAAATVAAEGEEKTLGARRKAQQVDGIERKVAKKGGASITDEEEVDFASMPRAAFAMPYNPPPLSLLEKDRGKPETGDIKANANIIKRTLQNFGITVEMDEISIGPSVTRYALKPAEGVKLARIVGLNNDLALALAAHPIRIEAPIPGKSLVGIEVPNTAKTTVGLATILASNEFQESEKALLVSLGKDITGRAHFCNLGKAPHMLIAGATGSGKSVSIHALITSLLYRNSPENLKFIMIDPKRVELTMYNKIPHLLTPVITDAKKAILALKWAGKEMSRRYDILEKSSSRDIDSYHKNIVAPALEKASQGQHRKVSPYGDRKETPYDALPETMPFIVIVIDELADIMQAYPRELESAVVRLAQMSRAVGIHLVLSTQRPSVNVITGLIKANIPTRVALQVASQIDSRTILDQQGAEKLLGAGDMLYLGAEMSKPVRLQSAFISESEVKRVVKYLADQYKDALPSEISLTVPEAGATAAFGPVGMDLEGDSLEEDDMYEPAREAVLAAGKASTSYIQRKLGVGYSRAAKLMDMLEERSVIGPANGSKPREVIGAVASEETPLEENIETVEQ